MDNKPIHYDGSVQITNENNTNIDAFTNEPLEITDEIRKNIGGNPFVME